MSHYKPYPAYKDSGVEWLGCVPEHWTIGPYKATIQIENGSDYKEVEADDGFPVIGSGGPFAYSSRLMYDGESVLLGRKGTIDKPLYINGAFWAVDTMYWSIIKPGAHGRFAYYIATTIPFDMYSTNTALPSMTKSVLGSHLVAFPVFDEQQAIADHLDHETARIDGLIEKKTRFIELLREKRQALITHAVTKGLNSNVKMKDSGVEWLGEVPEHWSFGRLAYACELIVDGTHHSPESYPEGAFKYITAKNIKEHGFDFTELTYLSAVQHQEIYSRCSVKAGDVLYIKDGATAGVAMVNYLDEEFSLLSSVAVIRPKKKRLLSEYLAYLLNSGGFKTSVLSRLVGGAITRFTLEMIGNFSVSLPSIEEQRQVVAHLEGLVPRLDVLKGKTERSIELLKERRSALITAAVTGQIDLRQAV